MQAQPTATVAAAPPPAPVPTQIAAAVPAPAPGGDRYVTIRSARCQTLLGLPEDDRAAASMFYIGDQASRLGARSINVSAIPDAEGEALNYCETFPNRTVAGGVREGLFARAEITPRTSSRVDHFAP